MSYNKEPKRYIKITSIVVAFSMLFQLCFPTIIYANTEGDGQAENSSFVPAGTSNMVNLFTGDLNYSIPLLDIEGYPISLSYNGNVGMNSDASWVGLGWSCSPGFINREMRGLPDDFKGDKITQQVNLKTEEKTTPSEKGDKVSFSISPPLTGLSWVNSRKEGFGIYNSAYNGIGFNAYQSDIRSSSTFTSSTSSTETLSYNSHKGYVFSKSAVETDKEWPIWPSYANSTNTSTTNIYNSGAGLTHTMRGAGTSSSFNTGISFYIVEVILTVLTYGAVGSGTSTASAIAKTSLVTSAASAFAPQNFSNSNGSSVISNGTPAYTPQASLNTFGQTTFEEDEKGMTIGFFSKSKFDKEKTTIFTNVKGKKEIPSYGFLNSTNWAYDSQVSTVSLYDMNRENDGNYFETTPNLPVTNATYDVYHVRGQEALADYRAFRNDAGSYQTPRLWNRSTNSGETHFVMGRDIGGVTKGDTEDWTDLRSGTGTWNNPGNDAPENLEFTDNLSVAEYEAYYFKNIGEKVSYNTAFYDKYGGDQPVRVNFAYSPYLPASFTSNLMQMGEYVGTAATLDVKNSNGTYSTINIPDGRSAVNLKEKREHRNNLFVEKKAGDPTENFLEDSIKDYDLYDEITNPNGNITVNSTTARNTYPTHHTSEIVVKNDQGGKYIYGIPVYNNYKEQTIFNVDEGVNNANVDDVEELVTYSAGNNSVTNVNGYNDYYNSSEVPKYTSAYMLTTVLNDDYIDVTRNGLTEDDHGNYTKFNYSKIHSNYQWRMPYGEDEANYLAGHQAYDDDEKGSYAYGKKEIWNVHSIESKNYIAEFYLSDRDDGRSVEDENGKIGTGSNDKRLKKLDKIKLYAKEDRQKNGANAVPIKTVHFKYDYSLCPDIPSNATVNGGKLTLTSVYFTYGNSEKGAKSDYEFSYADFDHDGTQDVNYSFSQHSVDRWGNYKPNNTSLLNSEYPFVDQTTTPTAIENNNKYAAAWRLSQIKNPEGAVIDIYYEADDYSFVQNKRAMQMFKIAGVGSSKTTYSSSNVLYNSPANSNNIIYFELQDDISSGTKAEANEHLAENYFKEINDLYFKSLVELSPGSGIHEYVEGYAKILDYGVIGVSAPFTYGYIELNPALHNGSYTGSQTNPIAVAGWQALRLSVPRAYRSVTNANQDLLALAAVMSGNATNDLLYKKRIMANNINLSKSWIRLVNPNQRKIGGGARVQKVTVKDSWGTMGGDADEVYGKTYEYHSINENGDTISAGVAAYEPFTGRAENPWRTPIPFVKANQNYPSDNLYQETPFGESHFPAPLVGYSSVKTKNIDRTGVTYNATGYAIAKFYTAKDFPTLVDRTTKSPAKIKTTLTDEQILIGVPSIEHSFASQGYVIIKNDMHGQKKGIDVYNEGGASISKSTIHYKSDLINGNSYQLNNSAIVINSDGTKDTLTIGKDIDMYNAYRETYDLNLSESSTEGRTYSGFTLFGLLGKIESSSISRSSKRLYTTVFTKVINQYGLIDRIETENLGTKNTLTNLAYDGETGNLLLSSVKNAYTDSIFTFQYPAHWYYDNLGQGYKNTGISLTAMSSPLSPHDGIIDVLTDSIDYFTVGDKLLLTYDSGPIITEEAWVIEVDTTNGSENITCINDEGTLIPFTADPITLTILESGRHNIQNVPIGTVTSLSNPILGDTLSFTDVIGSSAVELSDDWTTICEPIALDISGFPNAYESYGLKSPGLKVNPYTTGIKGKWRHHITYSYNQGRTSESTSSASDIRTDGPYTSFKPFWGFSSSGKLVPINDISYPTGDGTYENWKNNVEVTRYSKDGYLIEAKDILNRHTTSLYSYSPTLRNIPTAYVMNGKQEEVAIDGFEDYDYMNDTNFTALPGHFNFSNNVDSLIVENEAHTGQKSLELTTTDTTHHMGKAIPTNCDEVEYTPGDNYLLEPCDCERQFSPGEGKYILSAWVKQDVGVPGSTITDAEIVVDQFFGSTNISAVSMVPSGPVVEGWQRIEGEVNVIDTTTSIMITLNHNGADGSNPIYFDDLRMHPFSAAMKTLVYHPEYLRLMAELDNRNYATFFEYDEEGALVRIKRETENGIVTIKEMRKSNVKTP